MGHSATASTARLGWRTAPAVSVFRPGARQPERPGYHYLHNAVDDYWCRAYTEILTDETKNIAAAFEERANAWFWAQGIPVHRVLMDNLNCFRSWAFAQALGPDNKHKRTLPYRRQPNAKIERFHRTRSLGKLTGQRASNIGGSSIRSALGLSGGTFVGNYTPSRSK
ncbi:transposase family protein [Arthrobacter sp. S13_S34]|nr:transposase family protein [Arthrobacter sp. S13_S34]